MGKAMRRRVGVDPEVQAAMAVSRFWVTVDSSAGPELCWPWRGDTDCGYGVFFWQGRMYRAHELAVTFTTGEVRPEGFDTCHGCDNPPCCNPLHLRFGTRQDNVDDAVSRGRNAMGERQGAAKLTEAAVIEMRIRRVAGAPLKVLSAQYGVTPMIVSEICRGIRWRSVGGPRVESMGTGPKPKQRSA
jgi:hypothetical protein